MKNQFTLGFVDYNYKQGMSNMDSYSIGILAGGKSSRFGTDKATYKYQGISLLGRILMNLRDLTQQPKILVISVRDEIQYNVIKTNLEQELHFREESKFQGFIFIPNTKFQQQLLFVLDSPEYIINNIYSPMIGMELIFQKVKTGYCLILPCDSPFFPMKLVDLFLERMKSLRWEPNLLLPHWQNGYFEPLHGFYNVNKFLPLLRKNLNDQKFQLKLLYENPDTIYLWEIEQEIKDPQMVKLAFMNFNEVDDFQNVIQEKE